MFSIIPIPIYSSASSSKCGDNRSLKNMIVVQRMIAPVNLVLKKDFCDYTRRLTVDENAWINFHISSSSTQRETRSVANRFSCALPSFMTPTCRFDADSFPWSLLIETKNAKEESTGKNEYAEHQTTSNDDFIHQGILLEGKEKKREK